MRTGRFEHRVVCGSENNTPGTSSSTHGSCLYVNPRPWTQVAGHYCGIPDIIGSHSTQAEAQAACEGDAACLSIDDPGCDDAGNWRTCRSATGEDSSMYSGSYCLYVKP